MTTTINLTAAQAMMRWLSVQMTEDGERFIEGVWAIFGHGNVNSGQRQYERDGIIGVKRHAHESQAPPAESIAGTEPIEVKPVVNVCFECSPPRL